MKDLLLYLIDIGISGIVFAPLHVVAVRARRGAQLLGTVSLCAFVSAIAGATCVWLLLGNQFSSEGAKAVACVGGAISFLGLAGLYMLVGPASVDRSISAHILNLLYLAPRHEMGESELFRIYTHVDVLEKRFSECAETAFIQRRDGKLRLTRKGGRVARCYVILGRILGMRLWHQDRYHAQQKTR